MSIEIHYGLFKYVWAIQVCYRVQSSKSNHEEIWVTWQTASILECLASPACGVGATTIIAHTLPAFLMVHSSGEVRLSKCTPSLRPHPLQ